MPLLASASRSALVDPVSVTTRTSCQSRPGATRASRRACTFRGGRATEPLIVIQAIVGPGRLPVWGRAARYGDSERAGPARARVPRAEHERQLAARVRVFQLLPEQVLELVQAIAGRLRMNEQARRHAAALARLQPGQEDGGQHVPAALRQ